MSQEPKDKTIIHTSFPRRSFLKGALAAGGSTFFAPQLMFGKPGAVAPSERVNLACCGIGFRGAQIIEELNKTGLVNIVALCDTAMGAAHTKKMMKKFPKAERFQDFRQMFDKMGDKIDAVSVGTPDFSHFPIAMLAMSLGKHVYCEKPMGHSFKQVQLMMDAEKKYKVAAQMGNQGHSEANYFQFKAWKDAGIIKNVTKIDAFMNSARRWHGKGWTDYHEAEPVPDHLDYDVWQSTAAVHPYNHKYQNGEWRSWFDYGNGALGDWGAHIIDTAHEFLELGMPTEVEPTLMKGYTPVVFPQECTLAFRFPARGDMPPVEINWYEGQNNPPTLPDNFGSAVVDGDIPPPSSGKIDKKKYPPGKVIYGEGITFKGGSHGSTLKMLDSEKARAVKEPEVPRSPSNHFANFLKAAKGEEKCRSNFAVAGPLCQAMALGVIAQRINGKVVFDAKTRTITNHKVANGLLDGQEPRKEWAEFYKL